MAMNKLQKLLDTRSTILPEAAELIGQWKADVEALCLAVEALLQPLRAAQRLLIDRRSDQVTEEDLGTYTVDGRTLRFRDVPGEVKLTAKSPMVRGVMLPSGRWVVGVNGRVDLSYGALKVPLVRRGDGEVTWWVGQGDELLPFDESALESAIASLLE